jgi:hypothetical protein
MFRVQVVVLVAACAAGCKYQELPALNGDGSIGSGDASIDGAGSNGPNVVITKGPAAGSETGPRVTYEFSVRDGSPYCRFDNNQLAPCTSPLTVNLPAGAHTFYVQAQNSGGTIDSDSRVWTIACGPHQPTTDTFGLWHFDEGSGTSVANSQQHADNLPPPARNLTFADSPNDPSWVATGRFGSAVHFTAVALNDTDRLYAGEILKPLLAQSLGTHSMDMWVKPAPTLAHDLYLMQTSGGNQTGRMDYSLKFRKNGTVGNYILVVRSENNSMSVTSQAVPLGAYNFVAISFSPNMPAMLFVDGQSFQTPPIVGTVDMFVWDGFFIYEGDVDELHMTFHRYTKEELLDQWCPQ